jgi:hypothetical protein
MEKASFDRLTVALAAKLPRRHTLPLAGIVLGVLGAAGAGTAGVGAAPIADLQTAFAQVGGEKKKGKKGKKGNAQQVQQARQRCAALSRRWTNFCASFCPTTYGHVPDLAAACANSCNSCTGLIRTCNRAAIPCLQRFDAAF